MTPTPTLVPLRRIAPLVIVATLGELVGWGIALGSAAFAPAGSAALGAGWYGRGALLAMVHTFTLGTVAMAIVGVGWQVITVIVATGWSAREDRLIGWINTALLVSVPLIVGGIGTPGPLGSVAVTVLIAALSCRSALIARMLWRTPGRVVLRAWIVAAEGSLLVGLLLAAGLWAGRAGHPVYADVLGALRLHVALLLCGWMGGWIVGAGSLLLPMFAVAREPPAWLSWTALVLWYGGLVTGYGALMGIGGLAIAALLGEPLLRGIRRGPSLTQALVGVGAIGSAAFVARAAPVDVTVALLLLLGVLPVLRGVAQRIVPFLLWNHRISHLPAPPDLVPRRAALTQLWVSLVGTGIVVVSRFGPNDAAGVVGAALALAGAALHAGLLLGAWRRVSQEEAAGAARVWA